MRLTNQVAAVALLLATMLVGAFLLSACSGNTQVALITPTPVIIANAIEVRAFQSTAVASVTPLNAGPPRTGIPYGSNLVYAAAPNNGVAQVALTPNFSSGQINVQSFNAQAAPTLANVGGQVVAQVAVGPGTPTALIVRTATPRPGQNVTVPQLPPESGNFIVTLFNSAVIPAVNFILGTGSQTAVSAWSFAGQQGGLLGQVILCILLPVAGLWWFVIRRRRRR